MKIHIGTLGKVVSFGKTTSFVTGGVVIENDPQEGVGCGEEAGEVRCERVDADEADDFVGVAIEEADTEADADTDADADADAGETVSDGVSVDIGGVAVAFANRCTALEILNTVLSSNLISSS